MRKSNEWGSRKRLPIITQGGGYVIMHCREIKWKNICPDAYLIWEELYNRENTVIGLCDLLCKKENVVVEIISNLKKHNLVHEENGVWFANQISDFNKGE